MMCPETACGVICILVLIWFFTGGPMGSSGQLAGRHQLAGRRSGYLIYPYVDLSAPGPDGDQYVLHTCCGRQ